jgi:predicted HAD superfamily Cof-like phosphohydrolase
MRKIEMGINREYNLVKEFHKAFNHPFKETPTLLTLERAEKRYNWMKEEIDEFIEATKNCDIVEQADAMIDVIYFALGTLVEMGVEPENLFNIVQHANMSKLWEDGKPHYKEDGKIKKPEGWQDPHNNLALEVFKQNNK